MVPFKTNGLKANGTLAYLSVRGVQIPEGGAICFREWPVLPRPGPEIAYITAHYFTWSGELVSLNFHHFHEQSWNSFIVMESP